MLFLSHPESASKNGNQITMPLHAHDADHWKPKERWHMRHREIFHCLPSLSLPYKYSSNRSDQSDGPSRLRAAAVSRNDSVFSAGGSDASIVIRTFVFGSRSTGSSGRSTSPSKVAVIVLVISFL